MVQSFTDANHVWDDLWKAEKGKRKEAGDENPDKQDFFKIIYGVEAYLVDDTKQIVTNPKGQQFTDYICSYLTWKPPDFRRKRPHY